MEREPILFFEGKYVKLSYYNDFTLIGTILKVYEDSILFKTDQKTSAISIDAIKTLVER